MPIFVDMNPTELLTGAGVKPTANRILVLRALMAAAGPMSLSELEDSIQTMEKSSIFRVLTLLMDHELLHALEDGRGIVKYEVCNGHHDGAEHHDMHAHFYCERCRQVFCLESVTAPIPPLPEGFEVKSVNYMLKGLCADCRSKG